MVAKGMRKCIIISARFSSFPPCRQHFSRWKWKCIFSQALCVQLSIHCTIFVLSIVLFEEKPIKGATALCLEFTRRIRNLDAKSAAATWVFYFFQRLRQFNALSKQPRKKAQYSTFVWLGELEAELAGRKRKSPHVLVSVFLLVFFFASVSVVPPLPQSTSQQLKLCLSLFFCCRRPTTWCNQIANAECEAEAEAPQMFGYICSYTYVIYFSNAVAFFGF